VSTFLGKSTRWSVDEDGTRAGEVEKIGEFVNWIRSFLKEKDIILSGDFNYSGGSQVMNDMAQATGLNQIDPNAKSTFKQDFSGYASSYDHIYISSSDTSEYIDGKCSLLDATVLVYGDRSIGNMENSKRELSDHLPVWAAFDVTNVDDD
jgi:endonuclease/exonuclease/phosphatase family metal-dependent hydrolase